MISARSLPEWWGKTTDTPVPDRVKLRVFKKFGEHCQGSCGRHLHPGDKWDTDHKRALINGGENRESNLQPLCDWCHPKKTAVDVAEKSRTYRREKKHAGIYTKQSRPLPGGRGSNIRITMRHGPVDRRTGEPIRPGRY